MVEVVYINNNIKHDVGEKHARYIRADEREQYKKIFQASKKPSKHYNDLINEQDCPGTVPC